MTLIKISKRNRIILLVIAIIQMLLGYYLVVYNSFKYQSSNQTIGNVMILISISIFSMQWLNIAEKSGWKKYVYVVPIVAVGIIFFVFNTAKKNEYLEDQLNKYGVKTVGKVIDFEIEQHKNTKTEYATFKYELESKQYKQRIENNDNEYKLNQNLNLKISKVNPEMFKIIETEK